MNDAMVGWPSSSLTSSDHGDGRLAVEEDVDIAAEAQVLSALPDVEADPGLALAGIAAVDLHDADTRVPAPKGSS